MGGMKVVGLRGSSANNNESPGLLAPRKQNELTFDRLGYSIYIYTPCALCLIVRVVRERSFHLASVLFPPCARATLSLPVSVVPGSLSPRLCASATSLRFALVLFVDKNAIDKITHTHTHTLGNEKSRIERRLRKQKKAATPDAQTEHLRLERLKQPGVTIYLYDFVISIFCVTRNFPLNTTAFLRLPFIPFMDE